MKEQQKSSEKSVEKIDRDIDNLAPFFYERLKKAMDECEAAGMSVWIVEGYRSPKRQNWLYASGRSRTGTILTEASAWESMHQYGLAVDLCGGNNKKPLWVMPWDKIRAICSKHGLENLYPYEHAHFQIKAGIPTAKLYKVAHEDGLEAVWELVERASKN